MYCALVPTGNSASVGNLYDMTRNVSSVQSIPLRAGVAGGDPRTPFVSAVPLSRQQVLSGPPFVMNLSVSLGGTLRVAT